VEPVITVTPPASGAARQVLRAYFAEVASRYYDRPARGCSTNWKRAPATTG
jgi:hypothetical protein